MASLTGTQINNTYPALLKTTDNAALGATEKAITDGDGNASTLSMGTASASFTGTLDLSGATVTGLAAGGLVAGTGTGSMKSADFLTTAPAVSSNTETIAIGADAQATGFQAIAIGQINDATQERAIAIGWAAQATGSRGVAIQENSYALGARSIGIGQNARAYQFRSLAIGNYSNARQDASIAIGSGLNTWAASSIVIGRDSSDADAVRVNSVTIGNNINTAQYTVNIGNDQNAYGADGVCIGNSNVFGGDFNVSIGYGNSVTVYNQQIALGSNNTTSLLGAGVIGHNLTALWEDAITMNQIAIANYASLNYADNAAAATNGVPLGGVFHTDGILKVRHT